MFSKANPVWAAGLQEAKTITLGFYAKAGHPRQATLRVATSGFYRVFVNGSFVFYGPVRCAHGFFRVDEVPLTEYLTETENHVAVEVVNYGIEAYGSLRQPGFIQMELVCDDTVLAATGTEKEFFCYRLLQRRRHVQRYSFQRATAESYRLHADTNVWRTGGVCADAAEQSLEQTEPKTLLPRELELHRFPTVEPEAVCSRGTAAFGALPNGFKQDRSLIEIVRPEDGYTMDHLERILTDDAQRIRTVSVEAGGAYDGTLALGENEYAIVRLPGERTGLVAMRVTCSVPSVLYFLFDEILTKDGNVDPVRMDCANVIRLELEPGTHDFLSMEPYGFRYAKLVCLSGDLTVTDLHLLECVHPLDNRVEFRSDNDDENQVFAAAWQSFRQNAADYFTDCPTRERAGWLCDSFFIGRSAQFFTGDTRMERQFLQNFILPDSFEAMPQGVLPMCYPSDHTNGNFILNWDFWYVAELWDYVNRTGDRELAEQAKPRMEQLLAYARTLENEDGLLENLPKWGFVEWSKANELIQDINYPTNMVYAYVLRALGDLYNDPALTAKGDAVRKTVRAQSFNGRFFVDNAIRRHGKRILTGNTSETCQYHAFFFGLATPETDPELWQTLLTEFGPERKKTGAYPGVYPSAAFTGNLLRLDVLLRYGAYDQCRREVLGYYTDMARITGTLWEHMSTEASCNHGFASYVACLLYYSGRREPHPFAMLG